MVPYLYLFSVDFVTKLLSDFIEMNLYMQKFFIKTIIIIIVFCIAKVEYKDFRGYCMSRMFYLF